MKPSLILGLVLIAFGIFSLTYGGVRYTEREKVLDVGPIEAHTEHKETVPIPRAVGALAILGGVAVLVTGARRSA